MSWQKVERVGSDGLVRWSPRGVVVRVVSCMLVGALVFAAACREEQRPSLAQLAAEGSAPEPDAAADAKPLEKPAREVALVAFEMGDTGRIWKIAQPILQLLDKRLAERLGGLGWFADGRWLRLAIRDFSWTVDDKGKPRLDRLGAVITAGWHGPVPAGAIDFAGSLKQLLPGMGQFMAEPPQLSCEKRGGVDVCVLQSGRWAVSVSELEEEAAAVPERNVDIAVHMSGSRMVAEAVEVLGKPLVWTLLPEEVETWKSVDLAFSIPSDSITLSFRTESSGVMAALREISGRPGMPVVLPDEAMGYGLWSVRNIKPRLEAINELWGGRPVVSKALDPMPVLKNGWQTEAVELAAGYVGVVLADNIDINDPLSNFIYFIQPPNKEVIDARFNHVFVPKYFIVEDAKIRTGEAAKRVFYKNKKREERFAWYHRDGTTFTANRLDLVKGLAEQLFVPEGGTAKGKRVALQENQIAFVSVDTGRLVQGLYFSKGMGQGAGMGLQMAKGMVAKHNRPATIDVRLVGPADKTIMTVQVDGVLSLIQLLLENAAPMMKFIR